MSACTSPPSETVTPQEIITVEVVPVQQSELAVPIRSSGRLASKAELKLSFKIGGIIQRMFVEEGQVVKKGDLLAQLDLSEIKAQVQKARSVYEKAQRDLQRVLQLYQDNAVTLENYQDAQTGVDIARSNLRVAEFNLRHARINAPSNGTVLKRFMETNELVGPGMPVFFFGSTEKDWVIRVGLTDRDVVLLSLGDRARIFFDAYPSDEFEAQVSEIAETADPRSGLFEIELTVHSSGQKLVSGFIAKVEITPATTRQFAVIPMDALVEGNGYSGFIFVPDSARNRAVKKPVKIGFLFDESIAIESGLEQIGEVISAGSHYLVDGSPISIISPAGTASPPTAPPSGG